MAVSLKKSSMEKGGGGLWAGGEGLIKEVRAVEWDYNGTVSPGVPAIAVTIVPSDEDEQEEFIQYYSAGNIKYLKPSKNGLKLENAPGSNREGVTEDTNAGLFLASLFEPIGGGDGFPEERVTDELDVFEGTVCLFKRVEQPARNIKEGKGLTAGAAKTKSDFPPEVLLVKKIVSFPWDKGKKKAAAAEDDEEVVVKKKKVEPDEEEEAAPKKSAKAENGGADPEITKKAQKMVLKVLAENEEGILKKKLGTEVFALAKKDEDVEKIIEAVYDDEWIGDDARPWNFNPKTSKVTP